MKIPPMDVYKYNKGGAETVCFNASDFVSQ